MELQNLHSPSSNIFLASMDKVISSEFIGITGLIFSYDSHGYNGTIFSDYLGIPYDATRNHDDFIKQTSIAIDLKERQFNKLFSQLGDQNFSPEKAKYFQENFEKIRIFFSLLKKYAQIESWKIDIYKTDKPDDEEMKNLLVEIGQFEVRIFGEEIHNSPTILSKVISHIENLYAENHEKLSENDQEFLDKVVKQLKDLPALTSSSSERERKSGIGVNTVDPLGGKDVSKRFLSKKISRDKYVEAMNLCVQVLGIEDVSVNVEPVKNFSVSLTKGVRVPDNAAYAELPIYRVIALIAHEIERHSLGNQNNKKLIGNLKSLSYLGQEEGVAHVFEHLALGYNLDEIPMNRYLPRMLVGEVFSGKDFKRFLSIMNTLDGETLNVDDFFQRFKRGKDENLPGVNPKEKMYGMGALEVIEDLQNGENLLGFFIAKNGRSEQGLINAMISQESGKDYVDQLTKNQLILPLFLGEFLRYRIIRDSQENTISEMSGLIHGFIGYFIERYGKLFQSAGIDYRYLIKNFVSHIQKEHRSQVNRILEILKES